MQDRLEIDPKQRKEFLPVLIESSGSLTQWEDWQARKDSTLENRELTKILPGLGNSLALQNFEQCDNHYATLTDNIHFAIKQYYKT